MPENCLSQYLSKFFLEIVGPGSHLCDWTYSVLCKGFYYIIEYCEYKLKATPSQGSLHYWNDVEKPLHKWESDYKLKAQASYS